MKEENRKLFLAYLTNLDQAGKNEINTYETVLHHLYLSDAQATCCGHASVEEDFNERGVFNFNITLGPVNAMALVVFLQALPDEPDEDDDGA